MTGAPSFLLRDLAEPADASVAPARRGEGAGGAGADAGLRPPEVVLIGQFGVGNYGNDASLDAFVQMLRRACPDARIRVACTLPEVVEAAFGLEAMRLTRPEIGRPWLRRLNDLCLRLPYKLWGPVRAFRLLRDADVVVVPGTGVFDDFGDTPFGMPWVFLKWLAAARLRRRRVLFVSIGAGPAYRRTSRLLFALSTRCAAWRSYRDAISRDFVASLGVDVGRDTVTPDLVFGLDLPPAAARHVSGRLVVGVGVMNYWGWTGRRREIYEAYVARMATFVADCLARGHGVRMFTGQDNDALAAEDILARVRAAAAEEDLARLAWSPTGSVAEVMAAAQATDVVVATRFHNVIAALRAGVPVISLGYLPKHDVLAAEMGLADYCAGVEDFASPWLAERLVSMTADRARLAAGVRAKVEEYGEALRRQERALPAAMGIGRGGAAWR